jgi:hypothetical protein
LVRETEEFADLPTDTDPNDTLLDDACNESVLVAALSLIVAPPQPDRKTGSKQTKAAGIAHAGQLMRGIWLDAPPPRPNN